MVIPEFEIACVHRYGSFSDTVQAKKQGVANTAWAFATLNHRNESFFAALVRTAERRLSELNAQELANTA